MSKTIIVVGSGNAALCAGIAALERGHKPDAEKIGEVLAAATPDKLPERYDVSTTFAKI